MADGNKMNGEGTPGQVSARMRNILAEGVDVHRTVAAKALARIDGKNSVDAFIKALLDEDEDVRADASEALAHIGDRRAAKQLLENLLGDPAPQVKLNAIDGLAAMGHGEVVPLLRRLLRGRDDEITWDEEEYYATEWDDWTDVQLHALRALGTLRAGEAVGDIVTAMKHEDAHDIIEPGFKVLAALGRDGIAALGGFLNSADPRRRRNAAVILGRSQSPHAAEPVSAAFAHKDADVRYACGCAVMKHSPADARLKGLLVDANSAIRAQIVSGCLQYHGELAEVLVRDTSPDVRAAVYRVIAGHPDMVGEEVLREAFEADGQGDDEKLASAVILARKAVEPENARLLVCEVLGDEERPLELRLTALSALEELASEGDEEAVTAMLGVLASDKRQLRLKSMTALARLAGKGEWPNPAGDALLAALRGELVGEPEEAEAPEEEESGEPERDEGGEETGADNAEAEMPEDAGEEESVAPQSTLAAILSDDPVIADVLKKKTQSVGLAPQDMEFLQLAHDRSRKDKRRRLSPDPVVAPYQDVRRFAARLLGNIGNDDVVRALGEALGDSDREVVRIAADSLAQFENPDSSDNRQLRQDIIAALEGGDSETRVFLIRILGRIGGEEAVQVLEALLNDMDSHIVAEAINALAVLGHGDVDFDEMLNDEVPRIRLAAARLIASCQDEGRVEKLAEFSLGFDGCHRREGARLLRRVDRRGANSYLLGVLDDEARKVEWQAVLEILEEINVPDGGQASV